MNQPMNEKEKQDHSFLLSAMTYWEEPSRRNVLIRSVLIGSIGVTVVTHHLLPLIAGLFISGFLYLRQE